MRLSGVEIGKPTSGDFQEKFQKRQIILTFYKLLDKVKTYDTITQLIFPVTLTLTKSQIDINFLGYFLKSHP